MMINMIDPKLSDMFMRFGSFLATIMFARALYEQYLPHEWRGAIHTFFWRYTNRIFRTFSPYQRIIFDEYTGSGFSRNKAYITIETYLSDKTSNKARGLKASFAKDGNSLVLGLDDNEEVTDEFQGVKVWWKGYKHATRSQTISWYPGTEDKRYYKLTFHARHQKLITESYLSHIIVEGKAIAIKKRQRKLFTNVASGSYSSKRTLWSDVEFKHPATFKTLAMEPTRKQNLIDDLNRFRNAKDYYTKVGKPWKRGYLLYGPPGTGKSTMIAAISNMLEYDIYDLELTAVKDNSQLRKLLMETSSKSIIVIEDIDCSLDLTGQRTKKNEGEEKEEDEDKKELEKKMRRENEEKKSEVTLSGLLNFIDGIWSACGDEKLIIFTTNYLEKLDPALIRRGRMDVHIKLSYCGYEEFKLLSWNYLNVDSHPLFETIRELLEETNMTPADVAENLMPKSLELDAQVCLQNLVDALKKAKEDGKLKVEEEERAKEEAKIKAEKKKKEKEKKLEEEKKEENAKEEEPKEKKIEEEKKEVNSTNGEQKDKNISANGTYKKN